eukprot:1308711-Amphidinium_carterae.1
MRSWSRSAGTFLLAAWPESCVNMIVMPSGSVMPSAWASGSGWARSVFYTCTCACPHATAKPPIALSRSALRCTVTSPLTRPIVRDRLLGSQSVVVEAPSSGDALLHPACIALTSEKVT